MIEQTNTILFYHILFYHTARDNDKHPNVSTRINNMSQSKKEWKQIDVGIKEEEKEDLTYQMGKKKGRKRRS